MSIRRKQVIELISFLGLLFFVSLNTADMPVYAAEETDSGIREVGFSYKLDFPENQTDDSLGYYNLNMSPGQEQTLTGTLYNDGKEAITVAISINGAKTNPNGVISYGPSKMENDESLPYDFKDILTGPESVEIEAESEVRLELKLKMPDTSFDGVLVGGIEFKETNQGSADTSGGSKVINEYAYVTGVNLQMNDTELKPDMQYRETYASQENLRNSIMLKFSNIMATYAEDMTIEAQVMQKGSDSILYERKQTGMRMAPNTYIEFPISMNGEAMQEGNYTIQALVKVGGQSWEWTEDFEITKEEAEKYNERDAGLVQDRGLDVKLIAMIVGGVLGVVLVIGLISYLVKRNKKKKQAAKKKRKKIQN